MSDEEAKPSGPDHISVVTTPATMNGHCDHCGESKSAPNKGLGRAALAAWKTQHQHLDASRQPAT